MTVPRGAPPQAMQQKVNASTNPFAFRMTPYSWHPRCAQLLCAVLAMALFVMPLAGVKPKPPRILISLATELVPLGTGLRSPSAPKIASEAFAISGRIVFGPLSSELSTPSLARHARAQDISDLRIGFSAVIDHPTGRAPPAL